MKLAAVNAHSTKKDLKINQKSINYILYESEPSDDDYYIVLLDNFPKDSSCIESIKSKMYEYTDNFVICVAISVSLYDAGSLTDFYTKFESPWRRLLDRNGKHATAILAFGAALYSINGCADLLTSDFYDDDLNLPSYYYMGHQYKHCDCFVYPVDYLDQIYIPSGEKTYKYKFMLHQIKQMCSHSFKSWQPQLDEPIHIYCKTKEEVDKVLNDNMNSEVMAFDTETSGLIFYDLKVKCITLSFDGIRGYYLPFDLVDLELFAKCFMSAKHTVGANPKYDIKVLWYQGLSQYCMCTDSMDSLVHTLHSDRAVGLKPNSFIFTSLGGYDNSLRHFKKETGLSNYYNFPDEQLVPYSVNDAIATWRVFKEAYSIMDRIDAETPNEKFEDWPLRRWYETRVMPIYRVVVKTEYDGIYVDNELLCKNRKFLQEELERGIKRVSEKLNKLAENHHGIRIEDYKKTWSQKAMAIPRDINNINIFSTTQLGSWLYKYTDLEAESGYAKGHEPGTELPVITADESAQSLWILSGYDVFKDFADVKNCSSVLGSFVGLQDEKTGSWTGWPQYMSSHSGTSKIYQGYGVMSTSTYRFKSRNPNMQNVPASGKYSSYIKSCISVPRADLYTITTPSGKVYKLAEFEKVLTDKGYIEAQHLTSNSVIIESEDPEKPTVKTFQFSIDDKGHSKVPSNWNDWFKPLTR